MEQNLFLDEGREKELVFHGSRDSFGENEEVLKTEDDSGCTKRKCAYRYRTIDFKRVKMGNFLFIYNFPQ